MWIRPAAPSASARGCGLVVAGHDEKAVDGGVEFMAVEVIAARPSPAGEVVEREVGLIAASARVVAVGEAADQRVEVVQRHLGHAWSRATSSICLYEHSALSRARSRCPCCRGEAR